MKAVFTCGGTGGHINPALAVARVLLERRPDSEILFVGAEDGMEATLVPREGFRLDTLSMGMSHDLEAAVAEGATLVRIGTGAAGLILQTIPFMLVGAMMSAAVSGLRSNGRISSRRCSTNTRNG